MAMVEPLEPVERLNEFRSRSLISPLNVGQKNRMNQEMVKAYAKSHKSKTLAELKGMVD